MIYNFEDFSLNIDRQELRRGADLIAIEPQVFDLLRHLIQNREHVVSNQVILFEVGPAEFPSPLLRFKRQRLAANALGHDFRQ